MNILTCAHISDDYVPNSRISRSQSIVCVFLTSAKMPIVLRSECINLYSQYQKMRVPMFHILTINILTFLEVL